MPVWQRLLITLVIMLLTSYLVGLLWHWLFNSEIPSYLSGAVGGLSSIPTREFLRRLRPKQSRCLRPEFHVAGSRTRESRHRYPQATGGSASAARGLMPWRLHRGRARVAVTV